MVAKHIVIMLRGWKHSGKDTAANFLVDNFGMKKESFAAPLKEYTSLGYDLLLENFEHQNRKELPILGLPVNPHKDAFAAKVADHFVLEFANASGQKPDKNAYIKNFQHAKELYGQLYWTPRALLMLEASTKRSVEKDYWAMKMLEKIEFNRINKITGTIISDFRYPNEHEFVRQNLDESQYLIKTISIDRFPESPSTDDSERALDNYNFDERINNLYGEVTLEQLYNQISFIYNKLLEEAGS